MKYMKRTANEAVGGPYLAFEQDHWADKPSSAPGHLAAMDEVLQLAHLHGALEPNTQAEEADQLASGWAFMQECLFTKMQRTPTHVLRLFGILFIRQVPTI